MRCVVFGATGYLGTRLIPQLLATGHQVRVMARDPAKLETVPWRSRVEVVEGDVSDFDAVRHALTGQQALYYLVHSLMRPDFVEFDARAAATVAEAAASASLSRIVYVGGIIPPGQELSDHLASREEVGRLLRSGGVPTVELRAAAVIGAGSASFEMLRYLTERLPLMVAPRWLHSRIQPIAIGDLLHYLTRAADLPAHVNRPFDVGGPDRFTYLEMIYRYAAVAGLRRRVAVPVPLLSPRFSALWVDWVTPLPRLLAASLIESVENDVVCADNDIAAHLSDPAGGLTPFDRAVELALGRVRERGLCTRWSRPGSSRGPAAPLPTDPPWAGGTLKEVTRERHTCADNAALWKGIESLGAAQGRSWLSRLWVIDDNKPSRRVLRLRDVSPLPGRLWLELSAGQDDDGSVFRQRMLFQPYGVAGQLFWVVTAPLRAILFRATLRAVVAAAERQDRPRRAAAAM